jgi:hypothetical protein
VTEVSLSISHAPWIPERVESFERLRTQLIASGWPWEESPHDVEQERAPNWEWSGRMWRRAVEMGADWCLFLQDDVTVCPAFTSWIQAMIECCRRPADGAICLEVVHPAAQLVASAGHAWFTTRDGLVGCGYLLRRELLEEFLAWREPRLEVCKTINEDTLLGLWHLITGRLVLHPVPTCIDHDTEMASTYAGNGQHANRRPLVRWDTTEATDGTDLARWGASSIPHLGIFPGWSLPHLARRSFPEDYTEAQAKLDLLDTGAPELLHMLEGRGLCFMCTRRPLLAKSQLTGVGLCAPCVRDLLQAVIPG